jgi:hypothetical protein
MNTSTLFAVGLLLLPALSPAVENNTSNSTDAMQQRMQQTLPYATDKTETTYTRTVHGGVQHVVVKSASDSRQIKAVQQHLQRLIEQYRKGDFSMPERMHGKDMPGLAQLKMAKPDDIRFDYKSLENGGQIHFSSEYPQFVGALHEWFDAQISEHGNPAQSPHQQHHSTPAE